MYMGFSKIRWLLSSWDSSATNFEFQSTNPDFFYLFSHVKEMEVKFKLRPNFYVPTYRLT